MRSSDRALWRTRLTIDPVAHTVRVSWYRGAPLEYAYSMPDNDHLTLTPQPAKDGEVVASSKAQPVTMTRTPVAASYPLLDRGFHLVNEWGLER